jgi:A/G-specific adenine glycosylase
MLQQTRVTTVLPYYAKFVARFPTPADMALAAEQEVLALWAGLGYYTRARNLQQTAREIVRLGGFPNTYEGLRALPGIGDYTAAALGSICFGIPKVVVDGNVLRVMSRYMAETGEIKAPGTKERLREAAQKLLDPQQPAEFNQALMELGAIVCLPKAPQCPDCPWVSACEGRRQGIEKQLPIKIRRKDVVNLRQTLLVFERKGQILLWQRGQDDSRMAGFWELPEGKDFPEAQAAESLGEFSHSITHHRFVLEVKRVQAGFGRVARQGYVWKPWLELQHLPLSTMTRKALALLPRAGLD